MENIKLKNSDGVELEPPYEDDDGQWVAEDGWGCSFNFTTEKEALEFQRSLDGRDAITLFNDVDEG